MKNLSDILPLYGVEHDMLISKRGDLTISYELQLPEIFTLSNTDYESIHQSWIKAIKHLPIGTCLHKQDWFLEMQYVPDFDREHSFLSHCSDRYFLDRLYMSHRCRLMLTMPARDAKPVNSLYSSLLRKHIVPVETIDPAFAKSFEGTCSQFVRVLGDTGQLSCKRMTDAELVDIVNEYLTLGTDGLRRDLDFSGGVSVGEKHTVMFSIANTESLPAYCGPRITHDPYSTDTVKFPIGFVTPICQLLPCNHIYQQFIRIENTAAVLRKLEKKKLRLQSLSTYARENRVARDATDSFLQEAASEGRQAVSAHFHVLTWTNNRAKLQELRNSCAAAFSAIEASAKIETLGTPQLYWAGIPGNAADLPENETFLTFAEQASCLINTETGYRPSDGSFGIRLGERISGHPLLVDLSDEPMKRGVVTNRNKFVLGPSGSGKSFFTNHLLRSYYEQGAHIVLVDVGHSYKGLCDLTGGCYFTYSETAPISFNPFVISGGGLPDGEKKESIKTLLVALWKKDDESFSRSEYVALSTALQLYYEKNVARRSFNSFYEFLSGEFSDLVRKDGVKDKDFDLSNFLYVLRPFYKDGEYDYLLNAAENMDLLSERFIVFELDNIKDHPILLPVITIIVMEVFISKMRKLKGLRKIILIEEAWKAIMREGMAEYIKYLFKTVRKHFGEAIVVTQDVEDLISSPVVKQAVINNSDCKILLDQSKYENKFEQVQELLGLTEKEKALVLSLNKANDPNRRYKEVFISLGSRISKVYRVEVSPEEYLTYTTEEREKLAVTNAAEKYGSMEVGIKSIIQQQNSEA
ncbi:MAG: TraG family conjugative transposon ATPase [Bacteroidota bacterium]